MALDAKIKTELAKKAANVLADIRRAENLERDERICLAFKYLTNQQALGIKEKSLAFKACLFLKCGVKLLPGESAARRIGDSVKKTSRRILQIIEESR
jgi:hypothetical protein